LKIIMNGCHTFGIEVLRLSHQLFNIMSQVKINIKSCIENFSNNVHSELKERWNNWNKDLVENNIYEVIGGLLARQSSLAIQIANNMNAWNEDIAPIILRTMADNHINLAWILVNPRENSKQFIIHGLGQLKLELEHRKSILSDDDVEMKERLEKEEEFINSQKYTFLTEVNLGSWSGINTRKMAEEANIIDFYNYVYQPFSNCTHSTWAHISKYNTKMSKNPLHRFLREPLIIDYEPHLSYLQLAAKYLEKSFKEFDRIYNLDLKTNSSYENLLTELDSLFSDKKE
jgi:hypothetical protein